MKEYNYIYIFPLCATVHHCFRSSCAQLKNGKIKKIDSCRWASHQSSQLLFCLLSWFISKMFCRVLLNKPRCQSKCEVSSHLLVVIFQTLQQSLFVSSKDAFFIFQKIKKWNKLKLNVWLGCLKKKIKLIWNSLTPNKDIIMGDWGMSPDGFYFLKSDTFEMIKSVLFFGKHSHGTHFWTFSPLPPWF